MKKRTRIKNSRFRAGGLSRTPEYRAWIAMRQRCSNENNSYYHRYGGRGISVCAEWEGKGGFLSFYEHVGPRPSPYHSIGRIDNDGNYEPGNVRWETPQEQSTNTVRVRPVTLAGATKCIAEWARVAGVDQKTMSRRVEEEWEPARLLSPPEEHRSDHLVDGEHLITVDGRTQSVTAWARESGINVVTLRYRIRKGTAPEELFLPVKPTSRMITINGETRTATEWSELSGIGITTLLNRVCKKWPEDRLLDPPKSNERLIKIGDEEYSVKEWSRRSGIKFTTIISRLNKGWPVERLLDPPKKIGRGAKNE